MFYFIIFFSIVIGSALFALFGCLIDKVFDSIIEKMDCKQ